MAENGAREKSTDKVTAERQNTGNHDRPERERKGNEKFGGTRAGNENVEPGE